MIAGAPTATQRVPHFVGDGRIDWRNRPVTHPAQHQLLIRVGANALCGTDRGQLLAGSEVTPGHEIAGEVMAAGARTTVTVGTRGVVYLMDFCGTCRSCLGGATNQCLAKRGDVGFTRDGGLGQFVLVHETQFSPIGDEVGFAEATLLLDVMGTSSHALGRARSVRTDLSTLLVAGAGPVGLGVVAMARLLLGDQLAIVIADVVPYRLDLAERLGARPVDVRVKTLAGALRDMRLGDADVAIDTAGRASARRMLLDRLGRGGALVCVGHGEMLELSVSDDLIAPERAVFGSEYFRFDRLASNLELLLTHRSYLGQIVTHHFSVEQVEEAYRVFLGGNTGKVVVTQ